MRTLVAFLLLCFATGPLNAADPTEDEMLKALTPQPAKPLTRSLGRGAQVRSASEGKLELSVQFDYASARITPESATVLKRLAAAMKSPTLGDRHFRIEGHTDSTGSNAGNVRLSGRRAEAVRRFLADEGVEAPRLSAIGLGSAVPANREDTTAAVNRRVAILSLDDTQMKAAGGKSAATVQSVAGGFKVQRGPEELTLGPGARLREGDVVTTDGNGNALVRLDDGAKLLLREGTRLEVGKLQLSGEESAWAQGFGLLGGALRYVSGALAKVRPQAVSISTRVATIGLRGTDLDVVHVEKPEGPAEQGTYVRVNQGAVQVGGADGSKVELARDEQAYAGPPKPTTRGGKREPAAEKRAAPAGVFKEGALDELMR